MFNSWNSFVKLQSISLFENNVCFFFFMWKWNLPESLNISPYLNLQDSSYLGTLLSSLGLLSSICVQLLELCCDKH